MQIDKRSKVGRFMEHVVPGVVRPLRVLWNEIIGFVFLCLAAWAVPSAIRNVRGLSTDQGSLGKVTLSFGFLCLMAYFAISSFLRARKISRS
jgi:hypothetical protein